MPETSHDYGPPSPLLSHGATADGHTVNHHQSVRPKTTNRSIRFANAPLQSHTQDHQTSWNPTDSGAGSQPTQQPPIISHYTNHCSTPAYRYTSPGSGASMQAPPLCLDNSRGARPSYQTNRSDYSLSSVTSLVPQAAVQSPMVSAPLPQASVLDSTTMLPPQSFSRPGFPEMQAVQQPTNHPITPPYPIYTVQPNSLAYTSYAYPTQAPQVPLPSFRPPQVMNFTSNPHAAGQIMDLTPKCICHNLQFKFHWM